MNLQWKFRLGMVLLVFIPVIMMGIVATVLFSGMIEEKTNSFYRVSLQDTDSKLQYAFNEINTLSDMVIVQPVVQQLLKHPPIQVDPELAQQLNKLVMVHPKITSFALYSNHKLIYGSPGSEGLTVDPVDAQWYASSAALEGRPSWLGPGENGTYQNETPVLTHARLIKDYYSLKTLGSIVISVKSDVLEQALWGTSTIADSDIMLIGTNGTVVYDKSGIETGHVIADAFWKDKDNANYQIGTFHDEESMITSVPSNLGSWTLTAITPLESLHRESTTIRNVAIGLIVITLLLGLLFERVFIHKIVRTIIISARGMKKVEQGNFIQLPQSTTWNDETKTLIDGFNQMSYQIRDLLAEVKLEQKRKKEAEMHALVAQINPHFIYNSLESINSMAVLAGNRDISRMVVSLGKLLRISISENVEAIPLSMELEHVKHYLSIQKMRFRDKFDYELICPPELRMLMTLKLIVQPLVENALYHGIEKMSSKGFIRIEAMEVGHDLVIEIADNGLGFNPDQLELTWKQLSGGNKLRDGGVGMRNVAERIRIQYGPPYGLLVCSAEGAGTTVRIRIPQQWTRGTDNEGGRSSL